MYYHGEIGGKEKSSKIWGMEEGKWGEGSNDDEH